MASVTFKRGTKAEIESTQIQDGQLLMETDQLNNNKIYWVNGDEFHQKKSVVEEEITLCNKLRFIPITIYDTDGTTVLNDGIGLVSVAGGN